jgi:outer membrane protein assembly factor BamB
VAAALLLGRCAVLASIVGAPIGAASPAVTASWTVYHGATDGSGVAEGIASIDLSRRAWTSSALDGQLYGEPLVSGGFVFVATENDTVYALNASDGKVAWSTHLGTPVPSASLRCGNISPTVGITGTPVVDETRGEVFVVADELVGGRPAHELTGLDAGSGKVELRQDVDPAGATPSALLQRTGLTLDSGRVVFGYGGNYGDCSPYRGWVMSVPEAGGTPATFGVDTGRGESQGAVWMGGAAPVIDAVGNIWVTVGNGSVTSPGHAYDDSDSVLELSPALTLLQYFAPSSWASDNGRDLDLSTAPALLVDGQVVAAGKSSTAYLLDEHMLGGIGGQQALLAGACGDAIDGGVAVQGTIVYLPCLTGPIAVEARATPVGLRLVWHSPAGGGPPVVAAGRVWTIGQDGTVYGLDPATGNVVVQASVGGESNHFPTPSFGAGFMLVPTSTQVVAFAASGSDTTTTTSGGTSTTAHPPSTTGATATPPSSNSSGLSGWAVTGIVIGGLALAGALAWLLARRRRRGT